MVRRIIAKGEVRTVGRRKGRVYFRDWLKKELKDPEFKRHFDEAELEVAVAIQIAKIRERKHMTQRELAEKAHLRQQNISEIERGGRNITVETLRRVADALGKQVIIKLVDPKSAPSIHPFLGA